MYAVPLRCIAISFCAILLPFACTPAPDDAETALPETSAPGVDEAAPAPGDDQLRAFRDGEHPYSPWGFRVGDSVAVAARFGFASDFSDGVARVWVQIDSAARGEEPPRFRWGYVDSAGAFVIPPRYEAAGDFRDGRALVQLDDEFIVIDHDGTELGRLGSETDGEPLPLPADGVSSLEQYAADLDFGVAFDTLPAHPIEGEQTLTLAVRPLRHGAVEVVQLGWEGQSRILILPHHSIEDGRRIVGRLVAGRQRRDATDDGIFDDDLTFELIDPAGVGEFIGVRLRPGGGVLIHHTQWFG